jgi:hypothetical protein
VYDNGARSLSHWYRVTAISITYSEFAYVALVVQHAHRSFSYRIALLSVAHRILQYLWTLSYKRHKFWNRFLNYFCVLIFSTNFVWNISIVRRIQPDITNVEMSLCKVLATLLTVQSDLNFAERFSKNPQISNIMKILIVGAELFHADRRMDGWMEKQTWWS